MRRYLFLITDHPNDDLVGTVESTDTPYARVEKNAEGVVDMRDMDTDETWTERMVGLGYHDFESEDDYEERFVDVAQEKLAEIDEDHLQNAGLNPKEVLA